MKWPGFSKWAWVLAWALTLPLLVVAALLVALWSWTDTDTSLAAALNRATQYLPAGQSLTVEDVQGSLRRGGHIGLLKWKNASWTMEARQIDLAWQPFALLDRRLQLDSLHVRQLTIEGTDKSPAHTPLDQLVLPLLVDVRFSVDEVRWVGPPGLTIQTATGRYQFDHQHHALNLTGARIASGQYNGLATLQARVPLLLDVQVQGQLETTVPGSSRTLPLNATASLKGDLAGPEGLLDLQAQVQPTHAQLSAQIKPWITQPIVKAQADFSQLDLAAFWPQAPQTLLTGSLQVVPQGTGAGTGTGANITWQGQGTVSNGLSGPIDKGRLPVDSAQAQITFDQGQWLIQSLSAKLAGGSFQVQGRLGQTGGQTGTQTGIMSATSGWQGHAQLQNINPNAIHSQLAEARVDGKLIAKAISEGGRQGIEFDGQLQPSAKQPDGSRLQGLRLKSALAQGRLAGKLLTLDTLKVQTGDALLQGHVAVQLDKRSTSGQLQLALPGGQANAEGKLAAAEGAGDVSLRVTDAAQASAWLARLPGAPPLLAQTVVQGNGTFTGHWNGGWQAVTRNATSELTLQGRLQLPQFDLRSKTQPPESTWRLRDVNADLSGRISALTLALRGQAQTGARRFQLQTQVTGGRDADGAWQGHVNPTSLQVQDSLRPDIWKIQSTQPFDARWLASPTGGELRIGVGEATLTGPLPGTATVVWQPLQWRQSGLKTELKTQGQIRGLPMGWLELASNTGLASLGLSGNLLFDGEWDAVAADALKLQASLVRRSGDVQVRTDSSAGTATTVNAGVRDARLTITTEGDVLRAALRWDSERAGNAQADITTGFSSDAPLTGSVQARLPQVGVWSVLAPPGWRIRGTLDANITLAGTRALPQWSGTLQADDLALRSVVDGIEFSNGRLRTSLKGQRLDITEFSLQGAGGGDGAGARGGQLTAKGFAAWRPNSTGKSPGLSSVHMELDAVATALRLSARADRRLAVSGKLQARLDDAKLEIRGDLKADQALFILPDETAPSLGNDVVVKPSSRSSSASANAPAPTPAALAGSSPALRVLPDLALTLDLGPDFRVEGRGLATRLSGVLTLRSAANANTNANSVPRLTGEVRTVRGTYKAYGQLLDIDEGVLRFTGPYDNPALDILAIRPNLTVRVGVQISGTALAPRVRLYADPDLPEIGRARV